MRTRKEYYVTTAQLQHGTAAHTVCIVYVTWCTLTRCRVQQELTIHTGNRIMERIMIKYYYHKLQNLVHILSNEMSSIQIGRNS